MQHVEIKISDLSNFAQQLIKNKRTDEQFTLYRDYKTKCRFNFENSPEFIEKLTPTRFPSFYSHRFAENRFFEMDFQFKENQPTLFVMRYQRYAVFVENRFEIPQNFKGEIVYTLDSITLGGQTTYFNFPF